MRSHSAFLLACLVFLGFGKETALSQITAFTYQGRLIQNGQPAEGVFDLQFSLFSTETEGTALMGPVTAEEVTASQGLFIVSLDFGSAVFNGEARWLEIGVRPFGSGLDYTVLSPRQFLGAAPYAIQAGKAHQADTVADGAIGAAQLASGAVALNLNESGQSAVAGGGIILSQTYNTELENAGYVKIGSTTIGESWRQLPGGLSLYKRSGHTAVWTGSEMLIFGGDNIAYANSVDVGARYNPVTDTWTPMASSALNWRLTGHTAVWTGSEMLVWGGNDGNEGAHYHPATDYWTKIPTNNAPAGRSGHTAVWTGQEMIVWGGSVGGRSVGGGGRYDPVTRTWSGVTTSRAPSARYGHTAVWTGEAMVVWGGYETILRTALSDGASYDPRLNRWATLAETDAPTARYEHTAIWTGKGMIIWAGQDSRGDLLSTGAHYSPRWNQWIAMASDRSNLARSKHTAVWTGSEMLIWGGAGRLTPLATLERYQLKEDRWRFGSSGDAPSARHGHSSIWTGTEMLVWGGQAGAEYFNDLGHYDPQLNAWRTISPGLGGRRDHTAVWTGSEVIVWGGSYGASTFNSSLFDYGCRYDPALNQWTAIPTNNAPVPRKKHAAVWTGTEMIVWGGQGSVGLDNCYNSGGRYNLLTDSWIPMANAPLSERYNPAAVWTGSEVIVWGGLDCGDGDRSGTGASYNPLLDQWTYLGYEEMADFSGPQAFWTGREMLYFSGRGNRIISYHPPSNTWSNKTTTWNAPTNGMSEIAVWTGTRLLIWGGQSGSDYLNTGACFDPDRLQWTSMSTHNAPEPRRQALAVWTGLEMIVWGGYNGDRYINTGGRYNPATDSWSPMILNGAPPGRSTGAAVWTGSEMILHGGLGDHKSVPSGAYSYSPPKTMYLYQKP